MMDYKQAGFGLLIILAFAGLQWASQAGYFTGIEKIGWVAGVVVFSVLMAFMGKMSMPKASAEMKMLWKFAMLFAIVFTAVISFGGSYIGVFPAGISLTSIAPQVTQLLLVSWLVVFGSTMIVTGWQSKMSLGFLIGLVWLFSSLWTNSYIMFGLITGLSFVLVTFVKKGK